MARNYEELGVIGKGAYGTVFKAFDVVNNRMVALKRVLIVNNSEEKGIPVSTLREITLLKQLDNISHPNIVRMFDAFQTFSSSSSSRANPSRDTILTIVFEHVDQDLSMFLHNYPKPILEENVIKDLMYQLLCGLDYLHINRLIHRDIKPQNILITKNKQVKIADFGLARVYGFCKLITSIVVTLWYRPPELLLQCPYATMVDLWSVGAIMAEMYNRRPLFPGKSEVDQLHKILEIIGVPDKAQWPEKSALPWENFRDLKGTELRNKVSGICTDGFDLLKKLLTFEPSKRWNAKTCLGHAYFHSVAGRPIQRSSSTSREKIEDNNNSIKKSDNQNRRKLSAGIEATCSSKENSFSRVDSGIDLSESSGSSSDRQHSFSRSDSGICESPPTVDNVTIESKCCGDIIENFTKDQRVGTEDDLLKSPPRKMRRKEQ